MIEKINYGGIKGIENSHSVATGDVQSAFDALTADEKRALGLRQYRVELAKVLAKSGINGDFGKATKALEVSAYVPREADATTKGKAPKTYDATRVMAVAVKIVSDNNTAGAVAFKAKFGLAPAEFVEKYSK